MLRKIRLNALKLVVPSVRIYGIAARAAASSREETHWAAYAAIAAATVLSAALCASNERSVCDSGVDATGVTYETGHELTNWSATHSCHPNRIFEPKSAQEVCRVLENHHKNKAKIRPVGTALSPNGIGLANSDVISLSGIDYVEVDAGRQHVTVGAGARVADILKELSKYDLTLENFSSIQEQQIGGWTQVAAHGTGATLPTVEEMIVRMKLATPTEGLMTLSDSSNPRLFRMAKVGLGSLGVVTELTLRCIPRHKLLEYNYTTTNSLVPVKHYDKLLHFRHVRYMWFPYTGKVCVVVSNPTGDNAKPTEEKAKAEKDLLVTVNNSRTSNTASKVPTEAMCELLLSLDKTLDRKAVLAMSFSQLRDLLLAVDPLDVSLVKKINTAEAVFWERSAGFRADDSTKILGFDCGGAQWVLEVCFPIGSVAEQSGKDLKFVQKLLNLIEEHNLPAPCPIEQRWTARSTSPMSPAYSTNADEVFSWVGVIMYLPPGQTDDQRRAVTDKFREYARLMRPLLEEYGASVHWAKVEAPPSDTAQDRAAYAKEVEYLRTLVSKKYPVKEFNQYRDALDPHRILSNDLVEALFGK